METPKVARVPPVTIEFLRIVNRVEAARLCCEDCKATHVVPWDALGLPDDTPFPPLERLWKCELCGGTHVTAEPEWPHASKPERTASIEDIAAPSSASTMNVESGDAAHTAFRGRMELLMSRFVKPSTVAEPNNYSPAAIIEPPSARFKW